ncbi:MAG: dUTP diphosphatase [Candidatus Enteromonas sp.]|nr:dUTP diphosphatase [Candidatus Enteromonas sp.]
MKRCFEIAKGFEGAGVELPKRATSSSAGYDIRSLEDVVILPGATALISTGVKAKMPKNEVLLVFIRSSLGIKKGLALANGVGVIDADYYGNPSNDGEIKIGIRNQGTEEVRIVKGDRIAQGIFLPYCVTDDDEANSSREGGFGSSGRR